MPVQARPEDVAPADAGKLPLEVAGSEPIATEQASTADQRGLDASILTKDRLTPLDLQASDGARSTASGS